MIMQEALELINIGKSFLKKGDYDSAIVNFDLAKKLDPKDSDVYHCLALAYLKKDDLDLAIKNYKKVLEFNPKEEKILNCLGDLYTQKKKFKEALTYLNNSMAINPNNVVTHYYMGNYRLKTGDYDCAIESYKKARSLGSKSAKLYYGLGLAYKYKGEFALCENCMKIVLEKNPNDERAWKVYKKVANLSGAMKKFDKVYKSF